LIEGGIKASQGQEQAPDTALSENKALSEKKKKQKFSGISKSRIIHAVPKAVSAVLLLLLLAASAGHNWAGDNFGNVAFEQIVFHLNVPLKGTSTDMVDNIIKNIVFPVAAIWTVIILWICIPSSKKLLLTFKLGFIDGYIQLFPLRLPVWIIVCVFVTWGVHILYQADARYKITDYFISRSQSSKLIEEEYVSGKDARITFPGQKRNLICIYLESGESSAQDVENGGIFAVNYIPEMTKLAKENISFSQSEKIEGASVAPGCAWTIAGLVAETSGLPLKLPKNYNNVMGSFEYFMPRVVTLGDILEKEGYKMYFMAGSGFSFGGRERYFTQHGDYVILDYNWAKREGIIPKDYAEGWGIEDKTLYEIAKAQLTKIADNAEPFQFSILTVDTHTPNGYLCELCEDKYPVQYANVWACASRQLDDFVNWIREQPFYENTTIFICGDHLSMEPNFYQGYTLDDYSGNAVRKVYNAFINSAIEPEKETGRIFTTMDLFPTVLASIGADIEGDRLGIGTNLFSGVPTLSEKYGNAYLFDELQKNSNFYNSLFTPEN
ncbi:MAG: sulfatase-like hydrolase/transferase, partial [Parasporobacterium sp.]|nr:sulfatase-like hydrolase/transferase [Parasporobacterium sp.]